MKNARSLATVVLVAALFAPAAALADQEASLALELKIRMVLLDKLGVDGMRVDVRAADTVVLLAGTVTKRETAELAEAVAKSLDGVSRVENEIHLEEYVETSTRRAIAKTETERELKDALLHTRVRGVLIDRLGRDGFRVGVDTAGTTVSLAFPFGVEAGRRSDTVRVVLQMVGVDKVIELEKR